MRPPEVYESEKAPRRTGLPCVHLYGGQAKRGPYFPPPSSASYVRPQEVAESGLE